MTTHEPASSSRDAAELRPPEEVMRLRRMGAAFPTRLSFLRILLRRLAGKGWRVTRPQWEMDGDGYGTAVYRIDGPARCYSLVCFSRYLDPAKRTDRVIAEEWDASFVLFDGVPGDADIAHLAEHAPLQEAGRYRASELVISRANKSVRLFAHAVAELAQGRQPSAEMLISTGYLMRTTAVYGNGKFGLADRDRIAVRPEFRPPFQAEMLTVWLIRGFTFDLLDHCARARGGAGAAALAPEWRRYLGVGNATGLGMAPFLHSHPLLIHNWFRARETAIARVRALRRAMPAKAAYFLEVLRRVRAHVASWRVADEIQAARIAELEAALPELEAAAPALLAGPDPWAALADRAAGHGLECEELILALILEPHGALIDALGEEMASDDVPAIKPAMTLGALRTLLRRDYAWALDIDFDAPEAQARFWYVSEEKLEPRLGERSEEPGAERERPLHVARDVRALADVLNDGDADEPVAAFLLRRPEHRHIVRRVQSAAHHPYAEIRDNLIAADMRPIDVLRCKLAFFGASKFDPKSDRWTRIALFQGAPTPEGLTRESAETPTFAVPPEG